MEWTKLFKTNQETVILGGKKVPVPKLTYHHFKEITDKMDTLPVLVGSVVSAPKESLQETLFVACEMGLEEVIEIVSITSQLEMDYLKEKVGISEIIAYLTKLAEVNNYSEVISNIKSLLSKDGGE